MPLATILCRVWREEGGGSRDRQGGRERGRDGGRERESKKKNLLLEYCQCLQEDARAARQRRSKESAPDPRAQQQVSSQVAISQAHCSSEV